MVPFSGVIVSLWGVPTISKQKGDMKTYYSGNSRDIARGNMRTGHTVVLLRESREENREDMMNISKRSCGRLEDVEVVVGVVVEI